jgi:hypothetical protein
LEEWISGNVVVARLMPTRECSQREAVVADGFELLPSGRYECGAECIFESGWRLNDGCDYSRLIFDVPMEGWEEARKGWEVRAHEVGRRSKDQCHVRKADPGRHSIVIYFLNRYICME